MSETIQRRLLVRPAFRKWSTLALLVLLPIATHSACDYIQLRRLSAALRTIDERGEPLLRRDSRAKYPFFSDADRYYRGAAAVASNYTSRFYGGELARRFDEARQRDEWPNELVRELLALVAEYDVALTLIDRAADLPFPGFMPGTSYNYRWAESMNAGRLCALRAVVRAVQGDGAGALHSLRSQERLATALAFDSQMGRLGAINLTDLEFVLNHTRAPKDALVAFANVLADPPGGDNQLRHELIEFRTVVLADSAINPLNVHRLRHAVDVIPRPVVAYQLTATLDLLAQLIAAAEGPWPGQIDRMRAFKQQDLPPAPGWRRATVAALSVDMAEQAARWLARVRVARVAAAVEIYRRDHGEAVPLAGDLVPGYIDTLPIDPYSGQPLIIKRDQGAYLVYSVGADRKDNGGDVVAPEPPKGSSRRPDAPDYGLRVRTAPR